MHRAATVVRGFVKDFPRLNTAFPSHGTRVRAICESFFCMTPPAD
jgi:hypothetical protein